MSDSPLSLAESSPLLWLLAVLTLLLAWHVAVSWVREANRHPGWGQRWRGLALAAASLGAALCAATVLGLSAEALPFKLGYRLQDALLLLPGAMLLCALPLALLVRSHHLGWRLLAGVLLAGVALAVQLGWIRAVGFRPGISWREEFIAVAALTTAIGLAVALAMGFSEAARGSHRRQWRLGATVLAGFSLIAGQEVLLAGAGLLSQVGSVYQHDLSGPFLALAGGVVLPLALAVLAIDLELRRRLGQRSGSDPGSTLAPQQQRRRRRRRLRSL